MLQRFTQGLIGVALVLTAAQPAFARITNVTAPTNTGLFQNLSQTINTIFSFVILLAGIIFVILFLVGGVQYLTAAGNDEQTGKAKKLLVDAIVGLVLVLAAWAIGNFVLDQLNVNINPGSRPTSTLTTDTF